MLNEKMLKFLVIPVSFFNVLLFYDTTITDSFQITNCLLHFIFAGATPLFDYEFYVEGYAREADGSDYLSPLEVDFSEETEGSADDRPIVYLSKREVPQRIGDNEKEDGDVECGKNATSCTLRKRPTPAAVTEVNEKHTPTISEETRRKIAEVQAEPVILTQGV